jgi:FlaA1/EpsC-like NDP-sugar epimerase
VLVLPPVRELFDGTPTASDLRNVDVADLLGRQPIDLDMAAIADQISGKRILVTGAGGSIGSELCRQISRFGPSHLLMLDRDESGLHATQLSVEGRALLDTDDLLLCDIREVEALRAVFARSRPDIVFHAAALKHLTLLERNPAEAFKTNVLGTRNVLEAARAVGVETFVNISTDKAAQPTCVLGWSKRVAERLTAAYDEQGGGRYLSVRFGNVLGSRGSVVPTFMEQIANGGPVTVTHPDVSRFFMLIPEACQLVLQAGALGAGGEVMVLDMGSPVKIVEVAKTLIHLSGRTDVEIVYTGLRPGEKLTEELFTPGEEVERSSHPLISQVHVPALDPRHVDLHEDLKDVEIRQWLCRHGGVSLSSVAS